MRSRTLLSQSRLSTSQQQQIARRCFVQCQRYTSTQTRATRDDRKEEDSRQESKKEPNAPIGSKLFAFAIGGGAAFSYAWYRRQNASTATSNQSDGFIKYSLIDKEETSSSCSIFTIQPISSKSTLKPSSSETSILSIQIKQPQLQIARAYTCLPPTPGQPADSVRLLIRKEEKGEVSTYLHTLPVGSDVEVRGSYVDYAFPADTKEVIFLAGGTGIAPALKTAEVLQDQANVRILWANKKREDCSGGRSDHKIPPGLLTSLYSLIGRQDQETSDTPSNTIVLLLNLLKSGASSKGMTVDYFVDEEGSLVKPSTINNLVKLANTTDGSKIILVSGPNGFIDHWAGPKHWIDGKEMQGQLKGVLSKMKLEGWTIIKL